MQINPGFAPPGEIVVSRAGDRLTGSPKYSLVFTNMYTFSESRLKGLRLGGTAAANWDTVAYYYYPNGVAPNVRKIAYTRPSVLRFDLIAGYEVRFRKTSLSLQMNVNNVFNRYEVLQYPNATNGWAGPNNAGFYQQPRMYVWTLALGF
jgi:outer membrane receptor for ferric coprogen and ferric-rhodotorulic acid